MRVSVIFSRPLSDGALPPIGQPLSGTLGQTQRELVVDRSAFEALPGAAVLVAVGAISLQTLGAAPAKELPVLEPIGPAPVEGRRFSRAGITGFGAFSHSLSKPQARLTHHIRTTSGDWISCMRRCGRPGSANVDQGPIGRPVDGRSKLPCRKLLVSNSIALTGAE